MRPLPLLALLVAFASPLAAAPAPTVAFTLPDSTGIIEGLAHRESTGDFFLGDVHHRCVWRRDRAGKLTRFSPSGDELLGVFNLVVDEPRSLLWAATSMVPETARYSDADKGRAALVALDLGTGRLAKTYPLPPDDRAHVLGDLLLAPGGTVYLTDSVAPVIWRLTSEKSSSLEKFVESSSFASPQGLALLARDRLLVSDYARGLFVIDLTTRAIKPFALPAGSTLRGLDGLLLHGDTLYAVQNARAPESILRLALTPAHDAVTAIDTLAAGTPDLADLTLLTVADGQLHVIANSGWALAKPTGVPAHPVRILSFPL